MKYCLPFNRIRKTDVAEAGGKNASLGEMISELTDRGIRVPGGFALTAQAYRLFLDYNHLVQPLTEALARLDDQTLSNLPETGKQCRALIASGSIPGSVRDELMSAWSDLGGDTLTLAVRSSATAEDLPTASFAGQHDSFLNVQGFQALEAAVIKCYTSLFNDRAIKYRVDNGFEHMNVALSVGVQHMVRSVASGVAFTIDPETGLRNVIYLTGAWGLGENIVQGAVGPDEFYMFKQSVRDHKRSIIHRNVGAKEYTMVFTSDPGRPVANCDTPAEKRNRYCISDEEAEQLGRWCLNIEDHFGQPMDIEWAKDEHTGELFILQARPETVHSRKTAAITVKEYKLRSKAEPICRGKSVGRAIAAGRVCLVHSLADAPRVRQGDIVVADITNPDWNALLRKAVCIVTNKGGRTSHASIVARELGIHAVVGTMDATTRLHDGQVVTVSCVEGDEGRVYDGKLDWDEHEIALPRNSGTKTKPLFILADPGKAFRLSMYPNEGVGLLRMEFIITNSIRVHPMALIWFDELAHDNDRHAIEAITAGFKDKKTFFTRTLAESVAMVAAAFHPKEVIVRMSDFKTNEYAQLIGGKAFEPHEENPMLGFRGASRYYNERYREGFGLECEAMRIVRDEMGLTNVKIMIPFCRTVEEGQRVLDTMKAFGLERGKNGLEVYVMAEIPSNVILAEEFARLFDGFSIGSNDLTQLTLGIDRDSSIISDLFSERNPAVLMMLSQVIQAAKRTGKAIGLCGQAPSDFPEFAQFLVEQGIDSISFNPDALLKGIENIRLAEQKTKTSISEPVA